MDAISTETITTPIADPGLRQDFLAAVRDCHDRFTALGIDLSAFNAHEAGQDLLDLVGALGLTDWDVVTKGSVSRVVVDAMRSNPQGLRAVVAYNPEFPTADSFVEAIEGTRSAVLELEALCDADPACARRFPDLARTFEAAIRRFDEHPRMVRLRGRDVPIDGALLLRDLRSLLASIRADESRYLHLPATIYALAHAKDPTSAIKGVVSPELAAPTYCAGFVPVCDPPASQGAYYSALCTDIAPFSDVGALESLAGGEAAWKQDYVDGPYNDVCGVWQVDPADSHVTAGLQSDVPFLAFGGGLDPTVTPESIRTGIAGLPNAFFIVTPTWGHAPSTIPPCPNAQPRNVFLADPTSAPNTRCQERFQPTFADSPL